MHGFFVRWKINQYSQLCRYFTSNIYVYILQVWIFSFIDICWNECCLKTYIKRWTYVLEYIFGTWFFDCDYDSTKYKYSQIFFDPIPLLVHEYMPQKRRYFHIVMIHFSENTSSVNISNVLEQSLMEPRHPTSRPKFSLLPLFSLKSWRYYKLEVDSSNEWRFEVGAGITHRQITAIWNRLWS